MRNKRFWNDKEFWDAAFMPILALTCILYHVTSQNKEAKLEKEKQPTVHLEKITFDYNDSIVMDDVASKLHAQWFEETMAAKSQIIDFERLTRTRTEVSEAILSILYENKDKSAYQCVQIYEDKYNPDKKDPYKTVVAQDLRVYSVSVSRDDFDYLLQAYPNYEPSTDSYLIYPNDPQYRNGLQFYFSGKYPELKEKPTVNRHTLQKMYIQRMKEYERD